MPHLTSLLGFALVSLGMVLTPGPNMIYLISRSITQGPAAGLVSLGGVALGFVFYMLCAAFGITALLFAVPYAYDALRLAGAAYLLWLAWQALKPNGRSPFQVKKLKVDGPRKLFAMGFVTNLLNPKIAMLYLAAAAIHRSRAGQRADAIAGAWIHPDRDQRQRQCHDRAGRRIDRIVSRYPADLVVGAALADGHRARRSRAANGAGDTAGVALRFLLHLAPLAGRGRRVAPGEGVLRSIPIQNSRIERAPHPSPLPASAGRGSRNSIQLRFHAALDAGARHQRVVPAADMREIRKRHFVPAQDRKIGDR